jgi:hypothetical protein
MHPRRAIREAVKAKLLAADITDVGSRIDESRIAPHPRAQLPKISVYTDSESVDPASQLSSPPRYKRDLTLALEIWVEAENDVEDSLDELCLEVESALCVDPFLNNTCSRATFQSTEVAISVDGQRPVAVARMLWSIHYYSELPAVSDQTFDTFNTVEAKYTKLDGETTIHTLDQKSDLVTDINQE